MRLFVSHTHSHTQARLIDITIRTFESISKDTLERHTESIEMDTIIKDDVGRGISRAIGDRGSFAGR